MVRMASVKHIILKHIIRAILRARDWAIRPAPVIIIIYIVGRYSAVIIITVMYPLAF